MAPDTAILIPNLQKRQGWTKQNTLEHPDPSIDPNPPADCALVSAPPSDPSGLLFAVQGQVGKYCGWLSAQKLPYLPNTGHAQLDLDLILDPRAQAEGQAFELDFLVSHNGFNYLFGFEVLPQQNDELQISNPQAGWQAAFVGPGKLSPLVPIHFSMEYQWDESSHTFSFVSVAVNGVTYPIPAGQNPQNATNPHWSDVMIVQVQQDTKPDGGSYWFILDNVSLHVW